MSWEGFTDCGRNTMILANQEALALNHECIGTEHILLGMVKEGSGIGASVLRDWAVDLQKVRDGVLTFVLRGKEVVNLDRLPQTPRAKRAIEDAIKEARNFKHNYVGSEHLLLALMKDQEGVAAHVLMRLGLQLDQVREAVLNRMGIA